MPLVDLDTLDSATDLSNWPAGNISATKINGQTYLIASGPYNGGQYGVTSIKVGNNGSLSVVDTFGTTFASPGIFSPFQMRGGGLDTMNVGGTEYVFVQSQVRDSSNALNWRGITTLEIDANGMFSQVDFTQDQGAFYTDPLTMTVGGSDILVSRDYSGQDISTYAIASDGSVSLLDTIATPSFAPSDMHGLQFQGQSFVVYEGSYQTAILQVAKIDASGAISVVYDVPADDPALFNDVVTGVETVIVGNRAFVIASESTRGTLAVYEMDTSGALTLVDHELPGLGDYWGYGASMTTFTEGKTTYLAVGGGGKGIGIFEIGKYGSLTEVDEWTYGSSFFSGSTRDIEAIDINGTQYLFGVANDGDIDSYKFVAGKFGIKGSNKNDKLNGTANDDKLIARKGNDKVKGKDGDDVVYGGKGKDNLKGGNGTDNLYGEEGNDKIRGQKDDDWLWGQDGNDNLGGGDGNDVLDGGKGKDKLAGNAGNDRLDGDAGNDVLNGGDGLDELTDGKGKDVLTGGTGADVFVFEVDGKTDQITDFEDGVDTIDLTDFGTGLQFTDIAITKVGKTLELDLGSETIIVASANQPLAVTDISQSDFLFA